MIYTVNVCIAFLSNNVYLHIKINVGSQVPV